MEKTIPRKTIPGKRNLEKTTIANPIESTFPKRKKIETPMEKVVSRTTKIRRGKWAQYEIMFPKATFKNLIKTIMKEKGISIQINAAGYRLLASYVQFLLMNKTEKAVDICESTGKKTVKAAHFV